jgi:apolipoprotein N-acyltransferase
MDSETNPRNATSGGIAAILFTAPAFFFGTGLHPHWWLTWLAPIPVLLYSYRSSAKSAWLAAFVGFFVGCLNLWGYYQILELPIAVRVVGFVGPALIFTSGVMLSRAFFRRGAYWLSVLSLPALWISIEYLFSLGKNGTALNLAYSQMNFRPILQVASIVGIWGISFILFFFSSTIAIILAGPGRRPPFAATCLGIVIGVLAFGALRLRVPPHGEHVRIGLAATDRMPLLADKEADAAEIVQVYVEAVDQLAAQGAQIVVIPEKIGPVTNGESGPSLEAISVAAARNHVLVVAGLDHNDIPLKHNLSFVFDEYGKLETVYEKHFMVPHWEDGYEPGTAVAILPEPHSHWATAICKDMDFPGLSRQYGERGAKLMLVPAWDFTVDDWLHGRMAVLRGVESGFAIARSAKQGLMTISDNRGRILAQQHSATGVATLVGEITLSDDHTPYSRFGDWFAWLGLTATGVLIVIRYKKWPLKAQSGKTREVRVEV